jgi:predicted O-methyltransferase YrrM
MPTTHIPDEELAALDAVPGLMWPKACRVLYRYARAVPASQAIVELGVYRGRTLCWMAAGARAGHGAHVWGVDLWDTHIDRPRSSKNQAAQDPQTRLDAHQHAQDLGLADQVTLVQDFSAAVGKRWDGPPVGLMHIDGDHSENGVRADVEAWLPHLTPGAVLAFDDYRKAWSGVRAAVTAFVEAGVLTEPVIEGGRLAVSRLAVTE